MSKEEKKKQLKDELSGLLKGFDKTFSKQDNEHTDNLIDKKLKELKNSDVEPIDFEEIDKRFKSKAKGVIQVLEEQAAGIIARLAEKRDAGTA